MLYLPVDKTLIPLRMIVVVENEQYEFRFFYNSKFDYFTVSILKNEIALLSGEKLVIDKPMFTLTSSPFSETFFIPMDLSNKSERITFDNFGENVLIYMFSSSEIGVTIIE